MKMRIAVAAALLLALAGSSTADAKKITGKNVKNGSLTGKDIKNGSIRKTDIKKNTISLKQLSPGVRALILISKGTGARGPVGPRGPAGPAGGGSAGAQSNAATAVLASGDAGWRLTGASTFAQGELRLVGGFDGSDSNPAGGIGATKPFPDKPKLSDLSALSYAYHVDRKDSGGDFPTIHISVTGSTATNFASGFTNIVYNPVNNGSRQQSYNENVLEGKVYSTKTNNEASGATQASPKQFATFATANPDAVITDITVDNGDSSANTTPQGAFAAGADNALIGFNDAFTRYDFGG